MIDVDKTRSVLDQIAHAKDQIGLVRELVLASGGTWIDAVAVDMAFLFEVNLHGVRGFGLGASAAIDSWKASAKGLVKIDESLSAQIVSCNTPKQAQCNSEQRRNMPVIPWGQTPNVHFQSTNAFLRLVLDRQA